MKYLLSILFLLLCSHLSMTKAQTPIRTFVPSLTTVQDSLLKVLQTTSAPRQRLQILTNLGDVSLAFKDDYAYVEQLWEEALAQQAEETVITAGRSLTLRWLNLAQLDSADVWLDRCRKAFNGSHREAELKYLQLMRDIRDMGDQDRMAQKLIDEQLHIKGNEDSYDRMCVLYKLGVLALSEWHGNEKLEMKTWDSYMIEGYDIASSLPLRDSYSFRHQFLLALNFLGVDYVRQFMRLQEEYRELPEIKARPWYSHRSEIIGCSRMLAKGEELGRQETDEWFNRFCSLTTQYPYDCQTPYHYYFYAQAIPYYRYINDQTKIIECCDSVILNAPKYKFDNSWHYQLRGETLAAMGRWQEAYQNIIGWMAVKDSLANASSSQKLMELQTQYDVDRLRFESETSRRMFIFSTVICTLLVLSLWFLYVHFRTVHRKNRELAGQIRQSEAAEQQVEEIAKTIPEESLTNEERLFRRIQQLMEDKTLLASSKLKRDDLAELLNTNRTYVADAIKVCSQGMSVSEYINRKRVKHARLLLENNSGISLDEVADQCGFSSGSRFSNTFKEYYKMTPGEFRRITTVK